MEHPDLGQVARVVANDDGLADIRGQHRINVAQALKGLSIARSPNMRCTFYLGSRHRTGRTARFVARTGNSACPN